MDEAELIQALKEIRDHCKKRKNCIGCKYRVLVEIETSDYAGYCVPRRHYHGSYTGYCVFDKPVDEWPIENIKEDK